MVVRAVPQPSVSYSNNNKNIFLDISNINNNIPPLTNFPLHYQDLSNNNNNNNNTNHTNMSPKRQPLSAPDLVKQLLDPKSDINNRKTTTVVFNELARLESAAIDTIKQMWAESTLYNKQLTWARFTAFCRNNNFKLPDQLDYAAMLWVQSTTATKTLPATRLRYSMDLTSIASRLGVPVPLCRMFQSGLRSSGALIPQEQAAPFLLDHVRMLATATASERFASRLLSALFVAWKTASRWDEVSRLTRDQIVLIRPQEIIIAWGTKTKTTRADPFRADSQVILAHDDDIPEAIRTTLDELPPDTDLCPRSTEWFSAWIRRVLSANKVRNPERYSAHSVKRGALTFLSYAVPDHLSPSLFSILAKHRIDDPSVAPATTTLRYIGDPVQRARVVRTDLATILLPW